MALLRKSVRVWMRSVRHFGAERHSPSQNTMRLIRGGGRAIPTMLLQESNLSLVKYLNNNEPISEQNWIDIRTELMSSTEFEIKEATVDMTIVNLCLDSNKINSAMTYLQYLWDNGYDMNISSMMTYLKLCFVRKDQALLESEKDYIIKMYDTIKEKYPVLDASAAECCVMGLSKTERWKESFELLEMIKILDKPRSAAYTAIICAAFNHDEPEIGWKYFHEVLTRINPDHSAYITYLDYCKRNFEGAELEKEIGKMIEFWGERDVRPYVNVIAAYEEALGSLGWTTLHTSIQVRGSCRSCSRKLVSLEVTDEQFAKLAHTVRDRVIVGKDIYRRSSPEELKSFLQFIERTQPYDIVIDGLNVAYATKTLAKPNGSQLLEVFKMCQSKGKKVLVLGRKHMLRWPQMDINFMRRNGHVFLANDISEDDPYMLYATVRSGPHTQFVSKDLMRQHKFLLEDKELVRIFKYWQMAHQLIPVGIRIGGGVKLQLKNPPIYLPVAQKNDDGYHVPYTEDVSLQPPLIYEPPRSWVCFRKTASSAKGNSKRP